MPRALDQIGAAVGGIPTSTQDVAKAAKHSHGIKHEILVGLQHRLERLPQGTGLIHPAVTYGRQALEILVGIFFTFAVAAYWIFEKEKAQTVILGLVKREEQTGHPRHLGPDRGEARRVRPRTARDDHFRRDGALDRLLARSASRTGCCSASSPASSRSCRWSGPLIAGVAAILAGLTVDTQTAILAAVAVFGLRLIQDYVVGPKVLGHAVGLSPLIVLVTVSSIGLLFGGFYVLLATPFAAVLATLVDVAVLDKDPAEEEVPKLIFPAKDVEAS